MTSPRAVTGRRKPGVPRRPVPGPPSRPASQRLHIAVLVVVTVLCLLGLVMVLSASSITAMKEHGSSWYFFLRQVVWLAVGAVAMVLCLRVDYHRWQPLAGPLLIVAVVLLLALQVPGNPAAVTVNGSTRWLGWGPVSVQPSELAKLAVILYTATLLSRRESQIRDPRVTVRPVLLVLTAVSVLVIIQPDLGTTIIIAAIGFTLLFAAGSPLFSLLGYSLIAVGGAVILSVVEPYRRERLLSFLDPWESYSEGGYQTIQSHVGLASGGLFGTGLGNSRAKWGFLPEAHTDFIFAIIGEEMGLMGATVVVVLLLSLVVLGARVAATAPDLLGTLLATGVVVWIAVQAFVNIGAAIGLMPITGLPLPFVSSGGSSLVVSLAAVGLLLNIARQGSGAQAR